MKWIEAQQAAITAPEYQGVPLADEPATYFMDGTYHLLERLTVDWNTVDDMVRPWIVGAETYDHTALRILPKDNALFGSVGTAYALPEVIQGRLHYPVIDVKIDPIHPNMRSTNNTFRHEVGHTLQKQSGAAPYALRENVLAVRATAALLAGRIAAVAPDRYGLLTACATATLSHPAIASTLLHIASPREVDARVFALRTRKHNPIRLES
jgi:hypothetical protein